MGEEEGAEEGPRKEGEEEETTGEDQGKAEAESEGSAEAKADEPQAEEGQSKPSRPKAAPKGRQRGEDADPLDAVVALMQAGDFKKAAAALRQMLDKKKDDPVLLHNLGVVYTEQGKWAEAEDTFMAAFEAQKKGKSINYATLFGLATVLTEQGGTGKLLQAEALFRDCLDRAIKQEDEGIVETYRAFTSLAENLGAQRRWKDAAEAYTHSLALGLRMFGDDHPHNIAQKALLERAQRLSRLQKYMRTALWIFTAMVPIILAWVWKYFGSPGLSELFPFLAYIPGMGGSPTGAAAAAGAEAARAPEAPRG